MKVCVPRAVCCIALSVLENSMTLIVLAAQFQASSQGKQSNIEVTGLRHILAIIRSANWCIFFSQTLVINLPLPSLSGLFSVLIVDKVSPRMSPCSDLSPQTSACPLNLSSETAFLKKEIRESS
jgi:hypothetical protein